MNSLYMLIRMVTLTLIVVAVGVCSQSLFQESVEKNTSAVVVNAPQETPAYTLSAIVLEIDHQSGVVILDSLIGRLLTVATPAQLKNLHVGEIVIVHMGTNNPRNKVQEDEVMI